MEKKIGIAHMGLLSPMSRALLAANEIVYAQEQVVIEDDSAPRGIGINYRDYIDLPIIESYQVPSMPFRKNHKPNKGLQIGSYKYRRR